MNRGLAPRRLLIWALAALTALLCGCASPAYYAQAVSGHLQLMRSRQPIDDVLAKAAPGDPTAARLVRAQTLIAFAEERLGLPTEDSYGSYAPTPGGAVTWNVVVTPPYALAPRRWCFPVAGCVPYRGYFDREDAERFARHMAKRGRDVAVSGAAAYSTLGWFEDPILGTMLDDGDAQLADTLFHELAHRDLYVKGDTPFNESYATFLAREGVRTWMREHGDADELALWEEREQAARDFVALLAATRRRLARLYASRTDPEALAAGKAEVFADLRGAYEVLVAEAWDGRDRFGGWFDPPPNNADLALAGSYTDGLCAFETLWRDSGGHFEAFRARARDRAALRARDRSAWLQTPCPDGGGSDEGSDD